LIEDPPTFAFRQNGRWNLGALAGVLFVNVFWNGIVSVFVMVLLGRMPIDNPPQGGEWWFLFVFLIPFEGIGLIMVALLVIVVLEPFRRTTWCFERDCIVCRWRWPVYCRTRAWEVGGLDRLELRWAKGSDPRGRQAADIATTLTGPLSFELAVVSAVNVDLCTVASLTEGEARWMAGVILERRSEWFGE
jgi:hypothetical protein